MWRETQAKKKQLLMGKQEGEQELRSDEELLATHRSQVVFRRSGVHLLGTLGQGLFEGDMFPLLHLCRIPTLQVTLLSSIIQNAIQACLKAMKESLSLQTILDEHFLGLTLICTFLSKNVFIGLNYIHNFEPKHSEWTCQLVRSLPALRHT